MPLSSTLTKAKIIDAVAESNGSTRKKSIETVEMLLILIKKPLKSGDDSMIFGFGKFCLKKKRRGRNPANDKTMMLKFWMVATFKCSAMGKKIID